MDSHLLFELVYVLHRIGSSVIHGERGLMKMPRELCLFYSPSEGGLRNLTQIFLHDISAYPPPDGLLRFLLREYSSSQVNDSLGGVFERFL